MHLLVLVLLSVPLALAQDDTKYTTKYDNMDYNQLISSERLLKNYVNCLMDRGKCTPEASELKRVLSEALETHCNKCSEAQKNGIMKVIKYLVHNKQDWWDELVAKYDPEKIYREEYKDNWEKGSW